MYFVTFHFCPSHIWFCTSTLGAFIFKSFFPPIATNLSNDDEKREPKALLGPVDLLSVHRYPRYSLEWYGTVIVRTTWVTP